MNEQEKARQADIAAKKELVGKEFSSIEEGGKSVKIVAFEPSRVLRGKTADAFLVNLGNPLRNDFITCEDFNNTYKIKG